MASEIRVNQIQNRSGLGTVTFSDTGVVIAGVTTISDLRTSGGALTVGTGASISSPATNVLTLGTNNVESVRIDSSGLVGVGTTNPLTKVHIQGTGNGSSGSTGLSDLSAASALLLKPSTNSGTALALGTRNTGGHYIQGLYAASSVDSVRDVQINPYGGSVGIGTFADAFGGAPGSSTFAVATTGIERLRIDSSGRVTMPYQPVSCLYGNAGGSVNTGSESTWVIVKFANSTVNRGSAYSSATGLFTCPVAGVYFVSAFFLTRANAAHNITIYKNGTGIGPTGRDITPSGEQNTGIMAYVNCAANDTLGIYFSNGSGGDFYVDYNYALFSLFG